MILSPKRSAAKQCVLRHSILTYQNGSLLKNKGQLLKLSPPSATEDCVYNSCLVLSN